MKQTFVHKHKSGDISFFEITSDHKIIMSGNLWKEKRYHNGLPRYGSCVSGNLGSPERAKEILNLIIQAD
jgi:hypothetical protein